jgi:hypothetical protein
MLVFFAFRDEENRNDKKDAAGQEDGSEISEVE